MLVLVLLQPPTHPTPQPLLNPPALGPHGRSQVAALLALLFTWCCCWCCCCSWLQLSHWLLSRWCRCCITRASTQDRDTLQMEQLFLLPSSFPKLDSNLNDCVKGIC